MPKPWWLRRGDQAAVAVLIAAGLVSTVLWWLAHAGSSGRLLELDRAEPQAAAFRVDINTADWPEIAELPGIGPILAQRIVKQRADDGAFHELSDLRRVRGIGPITLKRIEPYLLPLPGSRTAAQPTGRAGGS